jgi:hypothetical protein
MYLEKIEGKLPGHEVKIKYDCDGGFDECGRERMLKLRYAAKNFNDNEGKHICRRCFLKSKNPMKKKEIKEKVRKTCLEKYGTEMPMNKKDLIEKRKAKFNDEEFKKQWVEKHRQTSLERYGVEHPMRLDETKEKQKKTMQEKYGVDHPLQSEEIKKKTRKTNMERYGVENVAQAPEVRVKMAQTTLQRYGVEHYNQLPEMKEYLRENCREWLAESWANPWAKGIVRPEEWNQKQRETVMKLMIAGEWMAGYPTSKKGFCYPSKSKKEKVYFRSSYEAIYCYHLDRDDSVDWFSFEPFRIPYEFEGKIRFYVPDFLIKWKDSETISIREIKAEFLRDDDKNIAKKTAATLFADQNGMDYKLLFDEDIKALNIEFDHLKEIGFVR